MASLKKLAGHTMWYGVSSIFSRFLNYLLTPYLTHYMSPAIYGEMNLVYSAIPFMNVLFTYGMETTFFRFCNKDYNKHHVFNIGSLSLLFTTLIFSFLLISFRVPLAELLNVQQHPQFITWAAWIIGLDTLTRLPLAKLRNEGRPRKYALIMVSGILINIICVVFFYSVLPGYALTHAGSYIANWYDPNLGAGYYIIANLISTSFTLLLLLPEFLSVRFEWDQKLWKEMMVYALPIMIAGFGGMINETFDRMMLNWYGSEPTEMARKAQVGIYSACYKLSLLITLFVQAFRMGAEPFFFQQAKGEDAPKTYARVMKFFVITICVMFLFVMLYIDTWKHFITNPDMWVGLKVVPLLLVANMCLGVYYNLSIWYRLSHKPNAGAAITFAGAAITLVINYLFIPKYGYMACAWATLACYGTMMVISYIRGQKVYPVPYATAKLLRYFGLMLLVYFMHYMVCMYLDAPAMRYLSGTVFLFIYIGYIIIAEKEELKKLPLLNKFIR